MFLGSQVLMGFEDRTDLIGPVEATALGNALIQGRTRGLLAGDLETLRALVRATQEIRRYEPRTSLALRGT